MMDEREPRDPDVDSAQESAEASVGADMLTPEEQVEKLREEKRQLEEEAKALRDQLLRRQAEFQNFRKRMERDQQEFRQSAQAGLVAELLPVLDAFELALSHAPEGANEEYHKGIELIYKRLFDTLTAAGLEPIVAAGQSFDPLYHHAVERVETTEHPDQQVISEMQRGYTFRQRLLRPALVRVAVHPGEPRDTEFED
jgi:molecular chaperone GrpE